MAGGLSGVGGRLGRWWPGRLAGWLAGRLCSQPACLPSCLPSWLADPPPSRITSAARSCPAWRAQDTPLYLGGVSSGASFALKLINELGDGEASGVFSEVLAIDPEKDDFDVSASLCRMLCFSAFSAGARLERLVVRCFSACHPLPWLLRLCPVLSTAGSRAGKR